MRLDSITLKHFKGQDINHKLGPLTLLYGPNGSGKSAILEGIQFGCEGRCSLGDSAQAALPLVGVNGGGVRIVTDQAFGWSRELIIDHAEGKVSQEIAIDGRGVGKLKETEGAIKERIGKDGEVFTPMFDLDRFLDLSDDKRRDFVLQLCARAQRAGGGTVPPPAAVGLLPRIQFAYLMETLGEGTVSTNRDRPDAIGFLIGKLSEGEREAVAEMTAAMFVPARNPDMADALNGCLTVAKDGISAARRGKDEANAAVRAISDRLAAVIVSAETAAALRDRLVMVQAQRNEINKQIARQEAVQSARNNLAQRIVTMKAEAERLGATNPAAASMHDPDALEAEANELAKMEVPGPNLSALEEAENDARIELGQAATTWSDLMTQVGRLKHEAEQAQRAMIAANADPWAQLAQMILELNGTPGFKVESEEAGMLWLAIAKFVSDHRVTIDREAIAANLETVTKQFNLANNEYEAANAIHDAAKTALYNATTALREARSKANEDAKAASDCFIRATQLREQARSIRNAIDRAELERGNLVQRVASIKTDLIGAEADLNKFDAELGGFVPIDTLRQQDVALGATAWALEVEIKAKDGNDRLKHEYEQCVAEAEKQTIKWEVCKKLAEAVKKLREEIMVELVSPLLVAMDEFFLASRTTMKAYCGLIDGKGSRVFDLGVQRNDRQIVYAALSGGERCLVGAALAYALVQLADPPLKLLLIEAAEADDFVMHSIICACETLSPKLSNVILATWVEVFDAHQWTKIALNNAAPELVA